MWFVNPTADFYSTTEERQSQRRHAISQRLPASARLSGPVDSHTASIKMSAVPPDTFI